MPGEVFCILQKWLLLSTRYGRTAVTNISQAIDWCVLLKWLVYLSSICAVVLLVNHHDVRRHVMKHVSLHAGFALRNCMTFVNIMECDVMV